MNGAVVIESYIAAGNEGFRKGSWVVTMQLPDALWPKVEAGELTGFSMLGKGERVPAKLNGEDVFEVKNAVATAISLVRKPATGISFVAKSADDSLAAAVATLVAAVESLKTQSEDLDDRIKGLNNPPAARQPRMSAIEKAEAEQAALTERQLVRKLEVLNGRLTSLWERPPPRRP
jgi:hypothetical protein